MKYKNRYGEVTVLEPEYFFRNKTLGIAMSGGADSTMLCYMVAKTSYQRNLNVTIQPFNGLDLWAPKDGAGVFKIVKHIRKVFPTVKIEWPVTTVFDTEGSLEDHKNTFIEPFRQKVINRITDEVLPGISSGPPLEIQKTFKTTEPEQQIKRLPGYKLWNEVENADDYRAPFKNIDKRFILEMYRLWDLVPLLEKTWSCTEPVETPCGGCWWCQERAWTVRQVFGDEEPQLLIYERGET